MTEVDRDVPFAERRAAIDDRLEDALAVDDDVAPAVDDDVASGVDDDGASAVNDDGAPAVDEVGPLDGPLPVPNDRDDRWYGQLLGLSAGAVAPERDRSVVLSAAASVELLREYQRLRGELLVQVTEATAHSLTRDPTAALLAGDYLFAAAFASLPADEDATGDCVAALVDASQSIVLALGRAHVEGGPSSTPLAAYFEGTAGALGGGAARIGATLAGAAEPLRNDFEALGRNLATARRIERFLERDDGTATIAVRDPDPSALAAAAERRRIAVEGALRAVGDRTTVDALESFAWRGRSADETLR